MNNKSNVDMDENCAKFLIVAIIAAILGYCLYNSLFRDVEKTSFYNLCGISCEKVEINNKLVEPLQCLNNDKVSKINLGYNRRYPDTLYMFINYKNIDNEEVRIRTMTTVKGNFIWEDDENYSITDNSYSDMIGKISFDNKTGYTYLITPKESLKMNREDYLSYLNKLGPKMCESMKNEDYSIVYDKKMKQEKAKQEKMNEKENSKRWE